MKTFDWSTLNRDLLVSYTLSLSKILLRKKISVVDFYNLISKTLKSKLPVKIQKLYSIKISKNDFHIGGFYEYDRDQQGLKSINLVFYFNNNNDLLKFNKYNIVDVAFSIADTILHEMIHMRQYRRRNFRFLSDYNSKSINFFKRKNQSYLGNTDEIDAYAFNISCYLLDRFEKNQKQIIKYLNKLKNTDTNQWTMYLETFDHNHNHTIIQRLKKRIIKYIPHALEGKPYNNKNWIYY